MRCKWQIENTTYRIVQKFLQIEQIGRIELLFLPIESSWQYWTWMVLKLETKKMTEYKQTKNNINRNMEAA